MKKILLLLLCIGLLPLYSNAQCTITIAQNNLSVCATQGPFPVSATATGFTTYAWTTSGTGTFSSTANIGTVYTPSAADITAGTATLTITASGGSCTAKAATATVTFLQVPALGTGGSFSTCQPNAIVIASVPNIASVAWTTSGSGSFTGNPKNDTVKYTPSAADIAAGPITLTAVATGNNACVSAPKTTTITFLAPNIVDAGLDLTTCQSTPVSLTTSSVTNSTSILWTTSGSGTFSNATTIHPVYQPSFADITAGNVTLTATATGSGTCPAVSDFLKLTLIHSGDTVYAGADKTMCGNDVSLNATPYGSGSINWTTSGTGTFSNTTVKNPTYTPSAADRTKGTIMLTISLTSSGACALVSADSLTLTINARVRLLIGSDITSCPNTAVFPTVSVDAGTVTWTSTGSGTFTNVKSLTPIYTPSAADNTAGQVSLTATSTANGSCPSETGTLKVTFAPLTATANAGADLTICGNAVTLNGSVTNATGGVWSTTGTGTFNPGKNYLNTTYLFSNADAVNGTVTFTLTTTGTCGTSVSDQVIVTKSSASTPLVSAGADLTSTDGGPVTLNGIVTGSTGLLWSTTGSGTFSSTVSATTVYTPSTLDKAKGLVKFLLTSTGNGPCGEASDTISLIIGNEFTLSGSIQAGPNMLDKGLVLIFKQDGTDLTLVKTKTITSTDAGTYSFPNLPAGGYIVFAIPTSNSNYLINYLPTYSGGKQDWQHAQQVTITGNANYNLSLTSYTSADPNWNTGNDTIAGIIYVTQTAQATARVAATGSTKPAAYSTVFLKDTNGNIIAYTQTDAQGRYAFKNVKAGKYTVSPESAGAALPNNASSVPVVADGNPATVEDASMTLEQRTSATTGILSVKTLNLITYPNPAKNSVSVNLVSGAGTGVVKLLNETGNVQLQQNVDLSEPTVTLNIETLPAGMYILQLTAADEVYMSKVIKY